MNWILFLLIFIIHDSQICEDELENDFMNIKSLYLHLLIAQLLSFMVACEMGARQEYTKNAGTSHGKWLLTTILGLWIDSMLNTTSCAWLSPSLLMWFYYGIIRWSINLSNLCMAEACIFQYRYQHIQCEYCA